MTAQDVQVHPHTKPLLPRMIGIVDTEWYAQGRSQLHQCPALEALCNKSNELDAAGKEARDKAAALAASHTAMSTMDETAADAQQVTGAEGIGHDVVSDGSRGSQHIEVGQLVVVTKVTNKTLLCPFRLSLEVQGGSENQTRCGHNADDSWARAQN